MHRFVLIFGPLTLIGLAAGTAWMLRGEPPRPGLRVVLGDLDLDGERVPFRAALRCTLSAEELASALASDPTAWPREEEVLAELRRGLLEPGGGWETAVAGAARRLERRLRAEELERLIVADRDSEFGFASIEERAGVPRALGPRPVLLVGIDAADWQLIEPLLFSGQLPNLSALYRDGARAVLRGQRPLLSPLLWTTMATGVDPYEHGIKDFVAGGVPITSSKRHVPAFWNLLSAAGIASSTVAWWATYPAEWVRGSLISDRVAYSLFAAERPESGLTHPASLGPDAVRHAAAAEVPAELLGRFVRLGPEAISQARRREQAGDLRDPVAHLIRTLRAMRTYHALALELLERRPVPVLAVYYQAVDEVCHRFVAARPPALPGAEAREAGQGGAIEAIYRYQDELLGELWQRFRHTLGPRSHVLVVSDHGFAVGADRPAGLDPTAAETASQWHRPEGIFLAAGPDIVSGALPPMEQTQVLPVLLAAVGLAPPAGLTGRVPEGLFRDPPPAAVPWPGLRPQRIEPVPEDLESALQADAQRLEELRRLGYVGEAVASGPTVNELLVDAFHFERAGERDRALRLLQEALPVYGHDETLALPAIQMALESRRFEEASQILEKVPRTGPGGRLLPVLEAAIRSGLGETAESIRARLDAQRPGSAFGVALALCDLALEHEDPAAAAVALREALELEPESPLVSARLEKLPEAAAAELLEAVAAAFDRRPHAASLGRWLGRRLLETRRAAEAEAVFRRLLQAAPADRDLIELWATAMVLAGRPQAAIRELEAVGQAGAHTAGTRAVLATAYAVQGRAEEAVEQYRDLLQAEPQRLEFYRPLAELLLRLGRKEEALRWVEAGIELAAGRTEQAALRQLLLQLER